MNNKMQADQILKKQLENVGDLQKDENGKTFRMINDKKIYQSEPRSEDEKSLYNNINAYRSSGFKRPSEWLKNLYGY